MSPGLLGETKFLSNKRDFQLKIAEMLIKAKFHCPILRCTCLIWIDRTFKIYGFQEFFRRCLTQEGIFFVSWAKNERGRGGVGEWGSGGVGEWESGEEGARGVGEWNFVALAPLPSFPSFPLVPSP